MANLELLCRETAALPKRQSQSSLTALYLQWLRSDLEVYERLTLAGKPLEDKALASFDVYAGLGLCWRLRFSRRAIESMERCSQEEREAVCERLLDLAAGRFEGCRQMSCGPMRDLVCLCAGLTRNCYLAVTLELNRLPFTSKGKLAGFEFCHFLRVVDRVTGINQAEQAIKLYKDELRTDSAKCIAPLLGQNIEAATELVSFEGSVTLLSDGTKGPKSAPTEFLSYSESRSYFFDEAVQRWIQCFTGQQILLEEQLSSDIRAMISILARSDCCRLMAGWLGSAKVSVQLSGEYEEGTKLSGGELEVLGTPGNLLAIGRSGTGKTTCAVLRVIGFMKLFRGWLRMQNHVETNLLGLHLVFVTASKALTKKVRSFFNAQVSRLARSSSVTRTKPAAKSMKMMKHQDFPLFFTVAQLIAAIDFSLRRPFFKEANEGKGTGMNAGFHNQAKKLKLLSVREKFAFEVTFECFQREFWPTVKRSGSLSAALVWAEIVSRLKGWVSSASYCQGHLPQSEYFNTHKNKSLLSDQDRATVWTIFLQYEHWKFAQVAYDFQDVVTHALQEIAVTGYEGAPIHYITVDEVQDLTHATLALLTKVTQHGFFLAGDTAQTIAKGITFRFKDLKTVFASKVGLGIAMPSIKQLGTNFRTHQKVLDLANYIVKLVELLFPKTIDRLSEETSENTGEGMIPIWVCSSDVRTIVSAMLVIVNSGEASVTENVDSNRVILLANEEMKATLPAAFRDLPYCTIYESKGDEFDVVVLYDFFNNCGVTLDQWCSLREYLDENGDQVLLGVRRDKAKLAEFFSSEYAALCCALKLFYVAVTRTKKQLLIYDESQAAQQFLPPLVQAGLVVVSETASLQMQEVDEETFKREWNRRGGQFMEQKQYRRAALCFRYAGQPEKATKAENLGKADDASRLMQAAEAILGHAEASDEQKQQANRDAEAACRQFRDVAVALQALDMKKEAAQCYFSGRDFERAAYLYLELKSYEQVAQCYFKSGDYSAAGKMYKRVGNYIGALEAYDKGRKWIKCLIVLQSITESIALKERAVLARKYAYLAFEVLKPRERVPVPASLIESKDILCRSFAAEDSLLEDIKVVINKALQNLQPDGTKSIHYDAFYQQSDVRSFILRVGKLVEPFAFEFEAGELGTYYLTSRFDDQAVQTHHWHANSIFTVLSMRKFSFLVAAAYSLPQPLKDGLEFQALAVSSVFYLHDNPTLAQYYAWIANYLLCRCIEAVPPRDIELFDQPDGSILPGLVSLGYWKHVMMLSQTYRADVARAFGDLCTAHQLYSDQNIENPSYSNYQEIQLCYLEGFLIPACLRHERCHMNGNFPLCETLYHYLQKRGRYERALTEIMSQIFKTLEGCIMQADVDPLALADAFTFYSLFLRCCENKALDFAKKLGFAAFEKLLLAGNLYLSLLDFSAPKRWVPWSRHLLRAALATYGVRQISGKMCFSGLPVYSHVLVSRSCQIFQALKSDLLFCVDIEGSFFLAPLLSVLKVIRSKIVKILSNLTNQRKILYLKNAPNAHYPFQKEYKLSDAEAQTYMAACLYGELNYIKVLQQLFPKEYLFVGEQGQTDVAYLNKKIEEMEENLGQLYGEEFEEDDVDFMHFIIKKNKKQRAEAKAKLRELEKARNHLIRERKAEANFSNFSKTLPLAIHEAVGWRAEISLSLTSIGYFYLQKYCCDLDKTNFTALGIISVVFNLQQLFRVQEIERLPLCYPTCKRSTKEKQTLSLRNCFKKLHSQEMFFLEELIIGFLAQHKNCLVLPRVQALDFVSLYAKRQGFCQELSVSVKNLVDLLREDICSKKSQSNFLYTSRSARLAVAVLANCDWSDVSCVDFEGLFRELRNAKSNCGFEIADLLQIQISQLPKLSGFMTQACCLQKALQQLRQPTQNHSSKQLCKYSFKTVLISPNFASEQCYQRQHADFAEVIKSQCETITIETLSEVKWKSEAMISTLEEQTLLEDLLPSGTLAWQELQKLLFREGRILHRLDIGKLSMIRIAQQRATVFEQREQVYKVHKLLALAAQRTRSALVELAAAQALSSQAQQEEAQRLLQAANQLGEKALADVETLNSKSAAWRK